MTPQRLQLVTFPAGVRIIPNPFNRIPGFMANDHYFVPGFPQMAHPMIEWALDTFHGDLFRPVAGRVEKSLLLTGPTAYESALLDLMERIVADYPALRLFSLPSLAGNERRHLELGVEGDPAAGRPGDGGNPPRGRETRYRLDLAAMTRLLRLT